MLVFIVLATLLCSSLIDARLAPLSTSEALDECKSQNQPSCNNPALEINPTTFYPTVNAPKDEVSLSLTVKNNEPLSFKISAEAVTWELKRPGAECSWLVTITGSGLVEFAEKKTDQSGGSAVCSGAPKRVVTIAVSISGTVDVTGGCNTPGNLKLTCEHAAPDSVTIPDWDIWAFGYIKASGYSDPVPSMTFENAYVVYEAPELTTTTSPGGSTVNTNGTENATDPGKGRDATSDEDHNHMMWFIIIGVMGLINLILIVALIVAIICIVKLKKNPGKQLVKKDDLAKKGKLDPDRTATVDRNLHPEDAACPESKSKRLEDENKLAAAETAQKPAPAEGQPEQKSQPSQEVFNNAAAAGSGNQPAADPQQNA